MLIFFPPFLTPGMPQETGLSSKAAWKLQHRKIKLGVKLHVSSQKNWEDGFCRPGNIGRILVKRKLRKEIN